MRRLLLCVLLSNVFAGCVSPPPLDDPATTEILRKQVSGAIARDLWEGISGSVEFSGQADFLGTKAPFVLTLFPDGRYRYEIGGILGKLEVFDGEHIYKCDFSGVMRELSLSSRDDAQVMPSILSGSWLSASSPFVLTSSSRVFYLSGNGGLASLSIELEAETSLPTVFVETGSAGTVQTTLADWKMVGSIPAPHTIRVQEGADGPLTELLVTAVRIASASESKEALTVDLAFPSDVRFSDSIANAVEVKRFPSGHILVHPLVNGEDVGWFLLDSGAGAMVIDTAVADALSMELVGEVLATGVGGTERSGFRSGKQFSLGPMEWEGQVYVELELAFLEKVFGVPIAGIIGYGFFSRVVLELEPAAELVAIYDPATYQGAGLQWSELQFDTHTASVMATFDVGNGPQTEPFRMDTGADGTVAFHTPSVQRLELKRGRDLKRTTMGGVGGSGLAYETTIPWFELGGHRFEKPIVTLSQFEVGVFTDRYSTGNIGQEFLEAFRLVFDYPNNRIAFIKSKAD